MELLNVHVRERLQAQDRLGYWLDGIIQTKRSRDVDGDTKQEVLVHFINYKKRQDEWIEIGSGRLLALGADTGALLDEEFQNTVGHVEEDQFEVDSIIKVRSRAGQFQFLIRWKGYSAKDDLWVAEDDVDPTSVAQFRALRLKKPRGASIPSGPYVLTVVDSVAPPSVCDALVKASMHLRLNL
jgi:Chromo (CHRromatin Organisation MOdifier) domain